uniref:Uncharacterized protein n=1 Tax=Zea mays TaxID=4577 RepID=B4FVX3_MAIZE|nr:unknown [Zea mays]
MHGSRNPSCRCSVPLLLCARSEGTWIHLLFECFTVSVASK